MKLFYISPSELPSRSANSVHVTHMCSALADLGVDVTLFARRMVKTKQELPIILHDAYGVIFDKVRLVTCYGKWSRATNLRIALLVGKTLCMQSKPDLIVSRNLYASYLISVVFRMPLIFETHEIEVGFRKYMQRIIMTQKAVTTIVISCQLSELLTESHGVKPTNVYVLRDAAPTGISRCTEYDKTEKKRKLFAGIECTEFLTVCGYFGHLYPGRGIELIEELARLKPEYLFIVFGGNDVDIALRRQGTQLRNLCFMGHVSHQDAQVAMRAVDVLLMPYQESVSIGVKGRDTARWMSPMKMFEYMASGVPIIASDLPALREVLRDGENALLVPPADSSAWLIALSRLISDHEMTYRLALTAYEEYLNHYNWTERARSLLAHAGYSN